MVFLFFVLLVSLSLDMYCHVIVEEIDNNNVTLQSPFRMQRLSRHDDSR